MAKVSIILSVHNQEKFLPASIESILKQSFTDFEFIIIDDASTDKSLKIIKEAARKDKRIKILRNKEKLGLTKSLNKAIEEASGKYIARMDADDISLNNRLKKQVIFMDSHKEISVLGTWAILIDQDGKKLKLKKMPQHYEQVYKIALSTNPFIHSSLMFRHSALEKIGFYNEDFTYAQDYELILRLLKNYKGDNIGFPLLLYRVGEKKSISIKNLKKQEWLSLKARLKALTEFKYPLTFSIFLLKPLLSYLIPSSIKFFLYRKLFWKIKD